MTVGRSPGRHSQIDPEERPFVVDEVLSLALNRPKHTSFRDDRHGVKPYITLRPTCLSYLLQAASPGWVSRGRHHMPPRSRKKTISRGTGIPNSHRNSLPILPYLRVRLGGVFMSQIRSCY